MNVLEAWTNPNTVMALNVTETTFSIMEKLSTFAQRISFQRALEATDAIVLSLGQIVFVPTPTKVL